MAKKQVRKKFNTCNANFNIITIYHKYNNNLKNKFFLLKCKEDASRLSLKRKNNKNIDDGLKVCYHVITFKI